MDWIRFQTRDESPERAFEAFCNHLFKRWCDRNYPNQIAFFNVTEGSGGDGGVESYAKLNTGEFLGLQAKWFREPITSKQIAQIRNSFITAQKVRPTLKQYFVCVPRKISDKTAKNKKNGRPQQSERDRWNIFKQEVEKSFPQITLTLWSHDFLEEELLRPGSEGISKYWFENEEISIISLKSHFERSKNGWLKERYISSLHGSGRISEYVDNQLGDPVKRLTVKEKLVKFKYNLEDGINYISIFLRAYSNRKPTKTKKNSYAPSAELLDKLEDLKIELKGIHAETVELIQGVNYGISTKTVGKTKNFEFYSIIETLEENKSALHFSFLHDDLVKSLKNIPLDEIYYSLESIPDGLLPHNLIFSGNPGTGKTHGLTNKVEQRLNENLPAVLIRAKDAPIKHGWGAVLRQELGLSSNWEEDEIWSALETCASRSDVLRANPPKDDEVIGNESTKVLICIDGLDESKDRDTWIEKIGELKPIIEEHPELRFCLSGRPYVFQGSRFDLKTDRYENDKDSLEKNGYVKVYISPDGDSHVDQLFDGYIKYYNIDISHAPWIRWTINTPLALKLFCENNRGKTIDPQANIRPTTASLLYEKIQRIDEELRTRKEVQWGVSDNVTLNVLTTLSDFFQTNSTITRLEAYNLISNAPKPKTLIDTQTSQIILDYLRDFGLLVEDYPPVEDPLRPDDPIYQFAYDPLNDYLIAEKAIQTATSTKSKRLPSALQNKPAAQQMAGLILLSDYNILIGDDGFWTNDLSDTEIEDLRLFCLSQIYSKNLEKYRPWIKTKIQKSMPICRKVIRDLVLRVARIDHHPLGPIFLHDVLIDFKNVASRDLIFSGPDNVFSKNNEIWAGWSPNPIRNEKLIESDTAFGMPLLFAWSLTSVDEKLRYNCRKELTKWGLRNPQEFFKLLQLTFKTNDPQMREDIVQVSSAIACLLDPKDKNLKTYADWTIEEIFKPEKLKIIHNIVIRHAGRIICERALLGGHISETNVRKARPPFLISKSIYPIDKQTIVKNEKYPKPVSLDLAEYVLPRACRGFFKKISKRNHYAEKVRSEFSSFSSDIIDAILSGKYGKISVKTRIELENTLEMEKKRQEAYSKISIQVVDIETIKSIDLKSTTPRKKEAHYSLGAENLLKKYSKDLKIDTISPRQLTTAACVYYLKNLGWNEKVFYGKPKGEKPGEILGVDIAISRQYHSYSRTERSSISSFAEKYVWCFVHEFIGYLADTLEYHEDYPEKKYLVTDYSHIFNIPANPAQELLETDFDSIIDGRGFFLPSNIAPEMKSKGTNRQNNLKKWINEAPIPDFLPWILPSKDHLLRITNSNKNPWLTLQLFTSITEPTSQGNSLIWINSFIIKNQNLKLFQRDCLLKTPNVVSFIENSITSYGHVKTAASYLTPFDALWMPWKDEDIEEILFTFQNDCKKEYKTYHTTTEGHYHTIDPENVGRERGYAIPSKIIRNLLKINKGTELNFYCQDGELEGFFFESGTDWRDGQKIIFIQRNELLEKLKENKCTMLWTIRLSRRSSMHALEEFPKMRVENDMFWVILLERDEPLLLEIKRSISDM